MSTPPGASGSTTPPPKTPGWGRGLFGIFSTAKKAPVAASTSATESGSFSPAPQSASRSHTMHINLNTPSGGGPRDLLSSKNEPTSALDAVAATGASTQSPTAMPPTTNSVSFAAKSPWKSPAMNGGMRFSQGSLKQGTKQKNIVKKRTLKKSRLRVTPSVLLVGPKRRTKGLTVDPRTVAAVLVGSKGAFVASRQQKKIIDNYSSFKPGKRLLGSSQTGSRLPPAQAQDDAMVTVMEPSTTRTDRKRSKVSFDKDDEPVQMELSTPAQGGKRARKATPFTKAPVSSTPEQTTEVFSPSRTAKVLQALPVVKLTTKPPYGHFGTVSEFDTMGDPIAGPRAIFESLSSSSNVVVRPTSASLSFEPESAPSRQPKKETKPKAAIGVPQVSTKKNRGNKKETEERQVLGWGNVFDDQKTKWKCPNCSAFNEQKYDKCPACEAARPQEGGNSAKVSSPGPSLTSKGSSDAKAAPASTCPFKFSATPGGSSATGFSFGGTPSKGGPTATGTPGGFQFGSSKPSKDTTTPPKSGGFSFSANKPSPAPTDADKSAPAFSFGTTSAPTEEDKKGSGFSFGASKPDKASKDSATAAPPFSFGKKEAPENGDKPKPFVFGSTASNEKNDAGGSKSFQFGAPTGALPVPQTTDDTSSGVGQLSTKAKDSPSGGANPPSGQGTTDKPVLSFGSDSTGASKPAFSFGATNSATTGGAKQAEKTKPAFSFGQPVDSSGGSKAPATSQVTGLASGDNQERSKRTRGRDDEESSSTPALSVSGVSNPPSAPVTFGASSSSQPTASSAPTAAFGLANSGSTTPAPSAPFTFGKQPATDVAKPAAPSFGATSNATPQNGVPAPAPGQSARPAVAPPVSQQPAPSFGSTPAAAPKPAGFSFGDTPAKSAPTFGSTPAAAAGSATPAASTFGSTPASATPAAPTFGSTAAQSAPSFGSAPAPAAPTFGSAPAPAAPTFGSTSAPSASTFGSNPAPVAAAFGSTPAPVAPAFGATPAPAAPAFGSTPAPAAPAFGSTPAPAAPAFGSTPAPAAPAFGSTPAPAAPAFGSTPAPAAQPFGQNPATAPGFSFGSAPQQPPANPPFAPFGGAPAPAAPAGGFGAPPQQPQGFGGGFGAPAPSSGAGMNMGGAGGPQFSIGTAGSSNKGTRRRIKARRPNSRQA